MSSCMDCRSVGIKTCELVRTIPLRDWGREWFSLRDWGFGLRKPINVNCYKLLAIRDSSWLTVNEKAAKQGRWLVYIESMQNVQTIMCTLRQASILYELRMQATSDLPEYIDYNDIANVLNIEPHTLVKRYTPKLRLPESYHSQSYGFLRPLKLTSDT